MLQLELRSLALASVAIAGGVSAALSPQANLSIVTKHISPDGFSRV